MKLFIRPITFAKAKAYIKEHHRHHKPPQGWLWGHSIVDESGAIHGVCCVGRPVARNLDDGETCEVTRLCTDGTANACSMLYGAARRTARTKGYARILTYILEEECGSSLKASGWTKDGATDGGSWDRPNRTRTDKHPTGRKSRWSVVFRASKEASQ